MAIPYTRSIWQDVRKHSWKYEPRARPPDAILWHHTGSGSQNDGWTEERGTINWFLSSNNIINGHYAGISHVLIGPKDITEVVPYETHIPRFSSWPSDEHAISVEVARAGLHKAYEPETIRNCAIFARAVEQTLGIELVYKPNITNDRLWTGMTGHQDTVQGKASGKVDPGRDFWPLLSAALEGDIDMERLAQLETEVARLKRLIGGYGIDTNGDRKADLIGDDALAYADDRQRQWSAFLGISYARYDIAVLQAMLTSIRIDVDKLLAHLDQHPGSTDYQKIGAEIEKAGTSIKTLGHGFTP